MVKCSVHIYWMNVKWICNLQRTGTETNTEVSIICPHCIQGSYAFYLIHPYLIYLMPLASLQICPLHICLNDDSEIPVWSCYFLALSALCDLCCLQCEIHKHPVTLKVVTVRAGNHQIQGYLEDAIDRNWDRAGWEVERKASIGNNVKERVGGEVPEQTIWECLLISLVPFPLHLPHSKCTKLRETPLDLPYNMVRNSGIIKHNFKTLVIYL